MAEKQTTARPYAEAVFALAQERNALKAWSEMLTLLAAVVKDGNIQRLANDPRVARTRLLGLLLDIGGKNLSAEGVSFLRLLVENRRLTLLPEIAAIYETLKAEAEARIEATVTSAFPLEPAQLKTLGEALKRRFGRAVQLTTEADPRLLGGIVIRAGDLVLDGSVRGHLARLASALSH